MKDAYIKIARNSGYTRNPAESALYAYMNSTFLSALDEGVSGQIKTVKLPWALYDDETSGANGCSAQVFDLCTGELNIYSNTNNFPNSGSCLDYFSGTNQTTDSKRIAYYNGAPVSYWIRDCYSDTHGIVVKTDGGWEHMFNTQAEIVYARPAMIFPQETLVNPSTFEILPN
jgi:hypothetical protein